MESIELQETNKHELIVESVNRWFATGTKILGKVVLLVTPLAEASVTFLAIGERYQSLYSINAFIAYAVAAVVAFAIVVLGFVSVELLGDVLAYREQRNKSDIDVKLWMPVVSFVAYIVVSLALITTLKIVPSWANFSIYFVGLLGVIAAWYYTVRHILDSAISKKSQAKSERSKLNEYRQLSEDLSKKLDSLTNENESLRTKLQTATRQMELAVAEVNELSKDKPVSTTGDNQDNGQDNGQPKTKKGQRQNKLLDILGTTYQGVRTDEIDKDRIGQMLSCSAKTVQRDLSELEQQNLITVNGTIEVLS